MVEQAEHNAIDQMAKQAAYGRHGAKMGRCCSRIVLLVGGWLAFVTSAKEPGYRFVSAWGAQEMEPGQFHDPTGLAVADEDVFVADTRNGRFPGRSVYTAVTRCLEHMHNIRGRGRICKQHLLQLGYPHLTSDSDGKNIDHLFGMGPQKVGAHNLITAFVDEDLEP